MCGLYGAFRREGFPTLYPSISHPATYDVTLIMIAYCVLTLLVSSLAILPGYRGIQVVWYSLRVFIAMFVASAIIVCIYGRGWDVAEIHSTVPYRAGSNLNINATITAIIGLNGINVTLKSTPEYITMNNHSVKERINYNERFNWDGLGWSQGNEGLAENDGALNRAYLKGKLDGLPHSILWVVEYFTLDGGSFRWGRLYQQAGFYTHCLLWLSLATWMLAILSVYMVKVYGGFIGILTGAILLSANATFAGIRGETRLSIPFENGRLEFKWGWCFWVCMIAGFIAVIAGSIVVLVDELRPDWLDYMLDFESGKDKECVEEEEEEEGDAEEIEENANHFFPTHKGELEEFPLVQRCLSIDDRSGPRTPKSPASGGLTPISESGSFRMSPTSEMQSPGYEEHMPRQKRLKRIIQRKRVTLKLLQSMKKTAPPRTFLRSVSSPAEQRFATQSHGPTILHTKNSIHLKSAVSDTAISQV